MAFASSNRVILRYDKEVAWGEVPAAEVMTALKMTSESLNHTKDTVESNTIRSDRMRDALLVVGAGADGDINFELAYGTYDDFLEAFLCGTWTNDVLKNGTTERSFCIERELADLGAVSKFIYYNGMVVSTFTLNIAAKEIVTGSFGFMGKQGVSGAASIAASTAAALDSTPLTASANVGAIKKDGVELTAAIKSIVLNGNNNARAIEAVGALARKGIVLGTLDMIGTVEFFVSDLSMYALMEAHTPFALSFELTDVDGNKFLIELPKIYLSRSNVPTGGINQEMMVTCDWKAVRDPVTDCVISITRTDHA